jgi:hypothetical protein
LTCQGREPVWENAPDAPTITGLILEKRQVLCTTLLEGAPDHRYDLAGESIWPFLLSLSVAGCLLMGGIFNPWWAVLFLGVMAIMLFGWFWTSTAARNEPNPRRRGIASPKEDIHER